MTRTNLLIKLLSFFTIILITTIPRCSSVISDKQLCCDPKCSVPIAEARTSIVYHSNTHDVLSFPSNVKVTVYSKGTGNRTDLWGVEINGTRGYAPSNLLIEEKVKCKPTLVVPTGNPADLSEVEKVNALEASEGNNVPNVISNDSGSIDVKSDSSVVDSLDKNVEETVPDTKTITTSYEVIDGTSIPLLAEELPTEGTYSTQIVQNVTTQNEQSTLDINPTIPSDSITFTSSLPNDGNALAQKNKHFANESEDSPVVESSISEEKQLGESSKPIVLDHSTAVHKNYVDKPKSNDKSLQDNSNVIKEQKKIDASNIEQRIDKDTIISNNNIIDVSQSNSETPKGVQQTKEIAKETMDFTSLQRKVKEAKVVNIENSSVTEQNMDGSTISTIENNTVDSKNFTDEQSSNKEISENETNSSIFEKENIADETSPFVNSIKSSDDNVEHQDINLKSETTKDILETSLNKHGEQHVEEKDITNSNVSEEIMNISDIIKLAKDSSKTEKIQEENLTEASTFEQLSSITNNLKLVPENKTLNETVPINEYEQDLIEHDSVDINNNHANVNMVNDISLQTNVTTDLHDNDLSQENINEEQDLNLDEMPRNRNLLNIEEGTPEIGKIAIDENDRLEIQSLPDTENHSNEENKDLAKELSGNSIIETPEIMALENQAVPPEVCDVNYDCNDENTGTSAFSHWKENHETEENAITETIIIGHNYWNILLYTGITAFTTLVFSLGYYYIENARRDGQLIAKINKLEKELLVSTKECIMLDETLKSTKCKLNAIEDESFGSNEMVVSLKTDLEASQIARAELEDQIATLEKELESATEAGLELERMLREFFSSHNEDNSLAQSVEDLQKRLNTQQVTNASLTDKLNLKTREIESLSVELMNTKEKYQQLDMEIKRITEELTLQRNLKNDLEETLTIRVKQLETQVKNISTERSSLQKLLKTKEIELKELLEVMNQMKSSNNLDLDALYNVTKIKAEASQLRDEKDELEIKLKEVEGSNELFQEHMTFINEEILSLGERCKLAEKEKTDAETRLEVLSNFFKEKEAQRQKEEALWLEKQGEVSSTVEKLQTMQNEIHNYKQQIEILKREILDQEREYKNQISAIETKVHEHWVAARQNERRLEESKAEASQLRNRLTLMEKNINENESDSKLHRLETNGETTTSPPLFIGAETTSSPIMFTGSSGVPPPPSYMYGPPMPHFLPPPLHSSSGIPPYEVGQRPPPLGGRLSSPPPMSLHHTSGRYENASSPPPPLSPPPLMPPYGHPYRSPPLPFSSDRIHPPLPPPPLLPPTLGSAHPWDEETPSSMRNSGFHPPQREQRARNHKGSLHSSGDSLDKSHHSGKV